MPPNRNVHVGVAALVDIPTDSPRASDHGLLMLRRTGGTGLVADGKGTWCVPGGWLEHEETPEQAAEREVLEETGIVVRAESRAGYVINSTERTIVTLFVRCEYVSGEPTITEPEKCQDVGWFTWAEIHDGLPLFAPLNDWLKE